MTIQTTKPDYRGTYHFSPAEHWMNDPNGMVFFEGEYHLFFQHHPFGDTWGPMHWGHAVSRDLVNWEELPIALEPDEVGTIFSGSAVVDRENTTGFFPDGPGLVAIFTHHLERPGVPTVQSQSLAYSRDGGRTWTKYEGNPVLTSESKPDFRDPKVFWHESSKRWILILACGQEVELYHSEDLKSWTLGSTFGEGIGSHDGVWECPDLFELSIDGDPTRGKWVMLVSIGDGGEGTEGSRTQYFTGGFDGVTFVPDEASQEIRWLDHGRDNYAGVSWSDMPTEDGRRLVLGWMSNWRYANHTPTEGWRGAMTIPRELTLETIGGVERLVQRPARELDAARVPVLELKDVSLSELNAALRSLRLDSFELEVRAQAGRSFEFRLREGGGCVTRVGIDAQAGELYIDRRKSGESGFHADFAGRHAAKLPEGAETAESAGDTRMAVEAAEAEEEARMAAEADAPNRARTAAEQGAAAEEPAETALQIFVDRSSVEVFEGDGRLVMTDLIFPGEGADGLSASAGDAEAGGADSVFRSVRISRIAAGEAAAGAAESARATAAGTAGSAGGTAGEAAEGAAATAPGQGGAVR
ncbi:glycoside hydrolase [Saccharibacillus sp. O23]|nr:glycoside hydrolase family 32 protein [Saccharibacillus sp. O23]OWR30908.1 glycoside hydrolase [Saccharibacillus sp. O23]